MTTDSGMQLRVPDLGVFFQVVSGSLLNEGTGFLFEALSGGDIRRGLDLVREFLQSGHTNADRALAAYLADGEYRFPTHEVLKGAVLGQFRYYNDKHSLLPNIFDSKIGSKGLQLLRMRIIHFLVEEASAPGFEGVSIEDLRVAATRMGVASRDFDSTCHDLVSRRMLSTRDGIALHGESVVVPTRLAGYALRTLCHEFAYCESCSLDTAIFDEDVWKSLKELTLDIDGVRHPAEKIEMRVLRLRAFLDYMCQSDQRWVVAAKRRSLSGAWTTEIVQGAILPSLEKDLRRVLISSRYNYSPDLRGKARALGKQRYTGVFISVWNDRNYAYIKDDDGNEWPCHSREFHSQTNWKIRKTGATCSFIRGECSGRSRALDVKVHVSE